MDSLTYLFAWLATVLAAIGVLSWQLARHARRREACCLQAARLVQALQRYSEWVCAQRLAAVFHGEGAEAAAALDEACTIRRDCFPDLAGEMAELLAVHNRIVNFLTAQQALWLRDPEHWLDSEHDKRFMALWRQHRFALDAVLAHLERATRVRIATHPAPRRDTTYA